MKPNGPKQDSQNYLRSHVFVGLQAKKQDIRNCNAYFYMDFNMTNLQKKIKKK